MSYRDEVMALSRGNFVIDARAAYIAGRADAEIALLREAIADLQSLFNSSCEDVARLREMLYAIVNRCEGQAREIARAALEQAK